jgi:hypothetical protein
MKENPIKPKKPESLNEDRMRISENTRRDRKLRDRNTPAGRMTFDKETAKEK